MKDAPTQLRDVHAVQHADGNWNHDPYMHGMANGLELALAIAEGREPRYREAPERWISESAPEQDADTSEVTPEVGTSLSS